MRKINTALKYIKWFLDFIPKNQWHKIEFYYKKTLDGKEYIDGMGGYSDDTYKGDFIEHS